jgi:hypothetical protein
MRVPENLTGGVSDYIVVFVHRTFSGRSDAPSGRTELKITSMPF